ncbi:MAG: hypothetical protein KDK36_03970 [Leptospiraceae bacterium]|nr:hypothetical protein [Leptospiraceae bacterium]
MSLSYQLLSDYGKILEYQISAGKIEIHAKAKLFFNGKFLEISQNASSGIFGIELTKSFIKHNLNLNEIKIIAETFHRLLENKSLNILKKGKSYRFGEDIISEDKISENDKFKLFLNGYLNNSNRGFVLRFDYSGLLSRTYIDIEMDEEEVKRFTDFLNEIISSKILENSIDDIKIPKWKVIVSALPLAIPFALVIVFVQGPLRFFGLAYFSFSRDLIKNITFFICIAVFFLISKLLGYN